ncbi:melanoma-associated antigen B1-like isoform X2 [Cervus elaphus]|uniref:melanoma-associated antigen B1-like isoform X2 n=1 Tax=Cervus elaphus TaxID=9860 RepID=UPI001CC2D272|nr:melanoma-associated antigen B1-like isoform X2 [Cervus elaphus]
MPRRQKSKVCGHEKHHQARAETQVLHDQATTSRGEETTSSSPPDLESAPSSSSAAGTPKEPQGAQGTTSAAAGAIPKRFGVVAATRSRADVCDAARSRADVSAAARSRADVCGAARSRADVGAAARSRVDVCGAARSRADVGAAARSRADVCGAARSRAGVGAEGHGQGGGNSSQASAAAESSHTDPLTMKVQVLVQKMLYKYKERELIKRSEMLKAINKRYRGQFPEILRRASKHIEIMFGLVLKEVRPDGHSYILVSNLDLSDSESMRSDRGLPKNGLLMPLLGVIYMNGHRLSEEKIWKILNFLGIYDGRRHFIFGDTRKFLTEDLVREEYVEYRQVPGSDPPRYEFLWGPRALMESNKMKVLEFLAKVNDTVPATFLEHFEESSGEVVESTSARAVASVGTSASGRAGTSVWDTAGISFSVWDGPSAAAQAEHPASAMPGISAAASAGPSVSASAHARAASSWSSRP